DVHGDLLGQVAAGDRRRDLRDVAHLAGEVGRHEVDAVGQVASGAGDVTDVGLTAEPALGADLPRHPGHLRGEGGELVHHRVDGVLQLQLLPLDVDGDLLGQVAAGHGGGHVGNAPHLTGQVQRHRVDVVGEVLPGAGHARHHRLAAQPAVRADF